MIELTLPGKGKDLQPSNRIRQRDSISTIFFAFAAESITFEWFIEVLNFKTYPYESSLHFISSRSAADAMCPFFAGTGLAVLQSVLQSKPRDACFGKCRSRPG
jgi:hypothetical protein